MSVRRSGCAHAQKNASRLPRLLRCEPLEPRTLLTALSPLDLSYHLGTTPKSATPPTIVRAASANVNTAGNITGTTAALSVLGNDAQGAASLLYTWTVTSLPAGGSARFSLNGTNAAKNDTVTFNEAGIYGISVKIVDPSGLSVSSNLQVNVAQTISGVSLFAGTAKTLVNPNTPLNVTGTSESLSAVAVDQFGNAIANQPTFTWSPSSYPNGAMPSLSTSGSTRTVTFSAAGSYSINVSPR